MNEDMRIVLATIYGEAAQSSPAAWRAIASVIRNRVGHLEWKHLATPRAVVEGSGFDACRFENRPFVQAMDAYGPKGAQHLTAALRALEDATRAIIEGLEKPVTPAVLYFSPRAQASLHVQDSLRYRMMPSWDWRLLEEVHPPSLDPADDFRFFKYRRVVAV